jgi:serine/threonine protein phosphatase 1
VPPGLHDFGTACDRAYAIGDVHGRLDLLQRIEALIDADIAATPPLSALVCYLGDYVDRGPHSRGVIEHLCARADREGLAHVFLMGNHEDRMLAFLEGPPADRGPAWLAVGGAAAIESYGVAIDPAVPDKARDWEALRQALLAALPRAHRVFLEGLRVAFRWGGYYFAHAGIDPARPLVDQTREDLLGIREPFLRSTRDHGVIVVHGHVPGAVPVVRPNRIGIDTAAHRTGCLTCVVLGGPTVRFLQTGQETSPVRAS